VLASALDSQDRTSNFASGAEPSPNSERFALSVTSLSVWSEPTNASRIFSSHIYEWGMREGSGVFARLMIRAITAAISSMITVTATKTVTKAMSNAVLA
jgi:hypothetical protein